MAQFLIPAANGTYSFSNPESALGNHIVTLAYGNRPTAGTITINARAAGMPVGTFLPVTGGSAIAFSTDSIIDFQFPIVEIQFVVAGITGGSGISATLTNW